MGLGTSYKYLIRPLNFFGFYDYIEYFQSR